MTRLELPDPGEMSEMELKMSYGLGERVDEERKRTEAQRRLEERDRVEAKQAEEARKQAEEGRECLEEQINEEHRQVEAQNRLEEQHMEAKAQKQTEEKRLEEELEQAEARKQAEVQKQAEEKRLEEELKQAGKEGSANATKREPKGMRKRRIHVGAKEVEEACLRDCQTSLPEQEKGLMKENYTAPLEDLRPPLVGTGPEGAHPQGGRAHPLESRTALCKKKVSTWKSLVSRRLLSERHTSDALPPPTREAAAPQAEDSLLGARAPPGFLQVTD
ncbi:hypothetical protein B0H65DRAFT_447083 [Neurospora tetraspora]|uniref:Uncharacterized protein n=1 Tax=Neurospora tetraspora TaxID=94610 RepID=A0AAE0MJX4_9PEZI|nr:hypothetical protein B0H65DRAFT_447083 [Neurospora tetraspora]